MLAREVAEIGIVEYREGIAKQEEATIAGEVKLAESELGQAKDLPVIGKGAGEDQGVVEAERQPMLSCRSFMKIALPTPSGACLPPNSHSIAFRPR